jgi:aryl-alcohol dehydrogenase-like predicted oxidoreductase
MEHVTLGRSGLRVSVLGLGTNAFGARAGRETAIEMVHRALDAGVTLFDTANVYQDGLSETILGEAVRGRRDRCIIATKAGLPIGAGPHDSGSSRHHLERELAASLRRLGTDYVDLYQVHTFDPATPLEETLRALDDMVRAGKVRYIGCSNYAAWEVAVALGVSRCNGWVPFASVQPSYSLADRWPEDEMVPMCLHQGVGLIAYLPLAGGILTGKYRHGEAPPAGSRAITQPRFARRLTADRLALADGVAALAAEAGLTPAQVALSWLIGRPAVSSAIAGATRVEQVEENLAALDVALTPEQEARLDELSQPFRFGPPSNFPRLDERDRR